MSRFTFPTRTVCFCLSFSLCIGVCFCLFMSHSSCHQCHFFSTVSTFDFVEDCFICGQFCNATGDPEHHFRREKNPGVLCRTADRGKDKEGRPRKGFQDVLLEVCKKRDDILGDTVMVRLQGAPSDLYATDTRY